MNIEIGIYYTKSYLQIMNWMYEHLPQLAWWNAEILAPPRRSPGAMPRGNLCASMQAEHGPSQGLSWPFPGESCRISDLGVSKTAGCPVYPGQPLRSPHVKG